MFVKSNFNLILRGLTLVVCIVAFSLQPGAGNSVAVSKSTTAFIDVTVVPMDRERILTHQTVIVRDGLIASIGPVAKTTVPKDAAQIDGRNKFLMPGLADMHVHLRMKEILPLFLANGVTTVRNLKGWPDHVVWRDQVLRGELIGPTIYTAGPYAEQPAVTSAEEATEFVRAQKKAGYDFIKVYNKITLEAYRTLVQAAKQDDIQVIGHIPRDLPYTRALMSGQVSIDHAEEFIYTSPLNEHLDDREMETIVRAIQVSGVWVTPTLSAYENILFQATDPDAMKIAQGRPEMRFLPKSYGDFWVANNGRYLNHPRKDLLKARYPFQLSLVKAMSDGGVKLMTGTDASLPVVIPGFSIHDELRNLVKAGLTPYQALVASTRNPGEFISKYVKNAGKFGTVAVGERADLILLEANPLRDVANLKRSIGVMVRGHWLTKTELTRMLENVATTHK